MRHGPQNLLLFFFNLDLHYNQEVWVCFFFFFDFVLKPPMHALMSGKQLEHNTAPIIPRQVWNISLYLFVFVCSFILCLATDNSWMMYMYYCDMFSGFFFFFAYMIPNHIFFENPSTVCTFYLVFKNRLKNKNMLNRGIGMDNRSLEKNSTRLMQSKFCFNFSRKLNTVCIRIHLNFNESAYSTFQRKKWKKEKRKKENELIICCFLIGSLTCLS